MKFNKFETIILTILCMVQFNHIVDFMLPMPLGPQLNRAFNLSAHEFGILVSCYTLSSSLAGLAFTLFVDQFNRKNVLIVFLVGFTLATLNCGLANTYEALVFSRCLAGIFGGGLNSIIYVIVGDLFPSEKRGAATGTLMASFSAASVIGIPLSLWASNHGGWHVPFIALGILAMFALVMVCFYVPSLNQHLKGRVQQRFSPSWDAYSHVVKDRGQILGILFMMFMMFGHFMIIPYIAQSLVANTGLKESELPLVYLIGGGLSFFTSPLIGRWADKKGKIKVFTIIQCIALVWILMISHLPVLHSAITLFFVGGFFVFAAGRFVPAMAVINGLAGPRYRASYMSLVTSLHQLSGSLASFICGYIIYFDKTTGRLENFGVAGLIACLFGLAALYIIQKMNTTAQT